MGINYDKVADGEMLKFEEKGPGYKIEGILDSYKPQRTSKGDGHVYEITTAEGTYVFFASSDLHKKLQKVSLGDIVAITYVESKRTNSGNDFKVFEVGHAPATESNLKAIGIERYKKVDDDINPDDVKFD